MSKCRISSCFLKKKKILTHDSSVSFPPFFFTFNIFHLRRELSLSTGCMYKQSLLRDTWHVVSCVLTGQV